MKEELRLGVFEDRILIDVFGHTGMKQQKVEETA
jgi:hypothetical protein